MAHGEVTEYKSLNDDDNVKKINLLKNSAKSDTFMLKYQILFDNFFFVLSISNHNNYLIL